MGNDGTEDDGMVAMRLRDLRRLRGLTQDELAERAGVKQPQVSAWEDGRRTPTLENVGKLARGFGMEHDELARELGLLGAGSGAAPRVVVVQGPAGETAVPLDRVVAYVEHFPDERHQARLERWRERHDAATYQRLCGRVYIAWSSNYELLLDTLDAVNSR